MIKIKNPQKRVLKIMKSLLFFLTIFFFNISAYSQTGLLTGRILDHKTNETLTGVSIQIIELKNTGTISDINGSFKLKLPVGSYSIKFSLLGYSTIVKTDVII